MVGDGVGGEGLGGSWWAEGKGWRGKEIGGGEKIDNLFIYHAFN